MDYIKVNLPSTQNGYEEGYGEGIWCLADHDAKIAYDTDEAGTKYTAILDNDSVYYPGLKHGVVVPIEMRGTYRPIVPLDWLEKHYGNAEW